MLTRDISLRDTVLDLLDNCLDGALRTLAARGGPAEPARPFAEFFARLHVDNDWFSIEDNCGGIALTIAREEAFRLGRPPTNRDRGLPTVGVYGIGMKRAIFKIGREAVVTSRYEPDSEFEVVIPDDWVNQPQWSFDIRLKERPTLDCLGTRIMIAPLTPEASESFSTDYFVESLAREISHTYALIIHKGFRITLKSRMLDLRLEPEDVAVYVPSNAGGIAPYVLEGDIDGVNVRIACGFYRGLVTEAEVDEEQDVRRGQNRSGWTVVCNDRVIVYQDRTSITGWDSGDVPAYHNQFRAFAGFVEFQAEDASKLPLTTTKRGIDVGSNVYLKAREYMKKGTKYFTDFTNRWKGNEELTTEYFERSQRVLAADSYAHMRLAMRDVPRTNGSLRQALPELPLPRTERATRRIVFSKPVNIINELSERLLGGIEKPAVVGEACFDHVATELEII